MAPSDLTSPQAIPVSPAAMAGFWIGLAACLLLMLAGPLYRAHLLNLYAALRIVIPTALLLGVISLLLSLFGATRSGSKALPLAGVVLGLIAAGLPAKSIMTALHSPIHDVNH